MRLLADTHVLLRWMFESKRLTRTQAQALSRSVQLAEPVAISAISLVEIGLLIGGDQFEFPNGAGEFYEDLENNPVFRILPITGCIAAEFMTVAALKDPMDRVIVATARCHRLKLVTSDQRIIDSGLVPVIE